MKADISRSTFRADKHYSTVRYQQGRVQVDADFNEQQDIALHHERTANADVIGADGAPFQTDGFEIQPNAANDNLTISAGRLYVNGILCENETSFTFTEQPDLPGAALPADDGDYLAYLEVRERDLGALEEPELRETALEGLDTTRRTQTLWQVQLLPVAAGPKTSLTAPVAWQDLISALPGRLLAGTDADTFSGDPCSLEDRGGYTSPENRLYRVEVHTPGAPGTATFKWSRHNATIATEWLAQDGNSLVVQSIGRDRELRFRAGDWIEISDERLELEDRPGTLARIVTVAGDSIVIDPLTLEHYDPSFTELDIDQFQEGSRRIRLWNDADPTNIIPADGAEVIVEAGIRVQFEPDGNPEGRTYRTGDYWLIPARARNRNIEWHDAPALQPPHGNQRHFVRLAFLNHTGGTWTHLADCRNIFPTLLNEDFTIQGGNAQAAFPNEEPAFPLRALVSRGSVPVPDRTVRFRLLSGDGGLAVSSGGVTAVSQLIPTNAEGVAAAYFRVGPDRTQAHHEILAELLDANDQVIQLRRFHVDSAIAEAISYETTVAAADGATINPATVQEALDESFRAKVNRSGDTITGDLRIEGSLTVEGDMLARDTEHIKGDVELGDEATDTVKVFGRMIGPDGSPLNIADDANVSGELYVEERVGVGVPPAAGSLLNVNDFLNVHENGLTALGDVEPAARLHIRGVDDADPLRVDAAVAGPGGRVHYIPFTVSYAGATPLINYQLPLTFDSASLIGAGRLRADLGDLRFVIHDPAAPDTYLVHWVESGINTAQTLVWVKLTALAPAASIEVRMYYGNPNAVSIFPRSAVFELEIPGLVSAWSLDENTGTSLSDASGNGNIGTLEGNTTWVSGKIGTAVNFDGVDAAAQVPHAASLDITKDITLALWFQATAPGTGLAGLIGKHHTAGARSFALFLNYDTGLLEFSLSAADDTTQTLSGTTTISYGQWYHVAAVYRRATGTMQIFLNGAQDASLAAGSFDLASTNLPLTFGATLFAPDGSALRYFFQGTIDEPRVYAAALSAAEAAVLASERGYATPAVPGIDLVRKFAADEPTAAAGTEITDLPATEETLLLIQSGTGNVGIGLDNPSERLSVGGIIETTTGGVRFPDGTLQTTAAGGGSLWVDENDTVTAEASVRARGVLEGHELQINDVALRLEWSPDHSAQLTASDGQSGDRFGRTVAIRGDYALIGAAWVGPINEGGAYFFERESGVWTEKLKITGDADDYLGDSVVICGNTAVIGVREDDALGNDSGAVRVYERQSGVWTQTQELTASDGIAEVEFGYALALFEDTLFVAHRGDTGLDPGGAVYVFERVGGVWSETQKFTAADTQTYDFFGAAGMAIYENTAVIGAFGHDSPGNDAGAAYVFERVSGTWVQQQKLQPAGIEAGDYFGSSIAMHGNAIVVGAFFDDDAGSSAGAVYVFERENGVWVEKQKLTADDGAAGDNFGNAVSISGTTIVVGARSSGGGDFTGAAYIFQRERGQWIQKHKLRPAGLISNDSFGYSVDISSDRIIVGASGGNGSTYIYDANLRLVQVC